MENEKQNPAEKKQYTNVKFLEYTYWGKGRHFISVIIKSPDMKKEEVLARIYLDHDKENKKTTYYAKDHWGQALFQPTNNLIELKKTLKSSAPEMAKEYVDRELSVSKVAEPELEFGREEKRRKEEIPGKEMEEALEDEKMEEFLGNSNIEEPGNEKFEWEEGEENGEEKSEEINKVRQHKTKKGKEDDRSR